jgi:hypothetical protein
MAHNRSRRRECFSVDEANATLPLVRAIVGDLANLSRDVLERRRRLSFLMSGRDPNDRDLYHEELVQIQEELEKDAQRLREYAEELRALGVEPVHGSEGIVTFPSVLEGRRVSLSWKLGEPEVLYWHEVDAGYRQRQPLTADSVASGSEESDNFA